MKFLKIFGIICVFLLIGHANAASSTQTFTGMWTWNKAPSSESFSLDLKQTGKQLEGQYCAVARNGNRVDCDDERNPNLNGTLTASGDAVIVRFSSFFGAKGGRAELRKNSGHLIWHILEAPHGGEFWAPKDAILDAQ
jgi:hypothetical protein